MAVTVFLARRLFLLFMKIERILEFEFGIVFDFRPYRRFPVASKIATRNEGISCFLRLRVEATSIFDRVVLPRPLTAPHL